ncbi:MAG: alkaline phosphatase [Pseudomonadota bacterium]
MKNTTKAAYLFLFFLLAKSLVHAEEHAEKPVLQASQTKSLWYKEAQARLVEARKQLPILSRAKNIVLFVGDGMGVATVTAARIHEGQQNGKTGEEHSLSFEKFPHLALTKTYNTDMQVPDSAGTATAMLSGVKTRAGILGMDETIDVTKPEECADQSKHVLGLTELAEMAGMATGVISTARITHATPAAAFSHSPSRNWEHDGQVPEAAKKVGCKDLARQLIDFPYGNGIDVVLGGGRSMFQPKGTKNPEGKQVLPVSFSSGGGKRTDGVDLIEVWKEKYPEGAYVWNRAQFDAIDASQVSHLFGLFEDSHLEYELDRHLDAAGEPSLTDMTVKALEILQKDPDGFFLLVESGRIDHAHHGSNAARALQDTIELSNAISAVAERTDINDTLIVVTADHSHTLTISGYTKRGAPILGLTNKGAGVGFLLLDEPALAMDGKAYTILGYANGPAAVRGERPDLTNVDTRKPDYRQQSLVPLGLETHSAVDVAIYARGPHAHLFNGTVEQNYIFHVMELASGLLERVKKNME